MAGGPQFFRRRVIFVETLRLIFNPRRLDAQPVQIGGNGLRMFGLRARRIRIIIAQDELPAGFLRHAAS